MKSIKTNIVMTVIGCGVCTLFIVYICTRLICARIQLRSRHRHLRHPSILTTLERGMRMHGVDSPIVANFPAKKYADAYFSSAQIPQCTICLAEYHKEDLLRILPYCGHYFHIKCIDIWLLQHCTCPVCRISLCETNEKKQSMQLMSSSRSLSTDFPAVSPQCLRFLPRTLETRTTDPIQEDQLLSHIAIEAARDTIT